MTAALSLVPPAAANALAECPACHTQAGETTARDLAAGAAWRCPCCHSFWDAGRPATVTRYNAWVEQRHAAATTLADGVPS
jgi:hypothetical protein